MADEISNPGDRASLDRLLAGLKQLDADLTRQVTQSADQTRTEIRRTRSQAAREARSRPVAGPVEGPARQPESVRAQAAAEERVLQARRESSRLLVVESRASKDRLSAAQRVAQAERDISVARARRLQSYTRQQVGSISSPDLQRNLEQAMRNTGLYRPATPPRRSTITDDELARRRELLTPPPPRPPRQPPIAVGGFDDPNGPRRQGISLSEVIGGSRRAGAVEDPLSKLAPHEAEAYSRALEGGGRSAGELDRELQRLTRTQALAGDQMRRHGLLTTEFLAAAADGRTTISELGVQIGGTIAKFGGWTAAASATYGALAAVQQLGTGAVESLNGVTSLSRVVNNIDTEKAQESFRSLAREFNLPISQVTAASFEAAKAFHTQADAAEATKAALFGVKVGELDAAESARFITAIYRGFHLQVSQLTDVMDVANQLQNRFGADLKGTIQGTAQAAGAFGAAGGNYRELAAFVATGQLQTGRTGVEIGTALRRTAEIVRRPERRQTILDVLGVDPRDTSITDILKVAQEKVAKGADPGVIARAITTPELASGRIIPILQAQARFQAVLREAQPDRATGSAQRELTTVLGGLGEKAKQLGVNLQNLGSALAQSGALDGAVVLLDTLNLTLRTTEDLINLFGELPRPLRQGLLIAAQFAGTLAVLRRFNVGQVFAGGGVLNRTLSRDPQRLGRAQVVQGLRDERDFVVNERQRATTEATRHTYAASQQRGRLDVLLGADDGSPEHARDIARAQQRLERTEQQALEAVENQADLAARHKDIVVRENDFRRRTTRRGGETVEAVGRDLGIFYGSDIQPRPNADEPLPILGAGGDPAGREARLRAQVSGEYQRVQQEAARAGRSRAFTTGAATLAAGATGARGLATGAKNLTGALASSLGPLELGVFALIGVFEAYQSISGQLADRTRRLQAIQSATGLEDLNAAKRQIQEQAAGKGGITGAMEDVQDVIADAFNFVTPKRLRSESIQQQRESAGRDAQRSIDEIRAANEHGVALTRDQIDARFKTNLQSGMDPDEALKQAEREANVSRGIVYAPNQQALQRAQEDVNAFKERLRNYRKTIGDVDKAYGEGLSLEQLDKANTVRIFSRGADTEVVRATGRAILKARQQLATTNDPDQQAQLVQQIQQAQQTVESELTSQFQRKLSLSRGPAQSGRLREQYLERMRALTVTPLRRDLENAKDDAEGARKDLAGELDATDSGSIRSATGPERAQALKAREDRIKQLREQIKGGDTRSKRLRQQLKREQSQYDLLDREQSRAQFQDSQALYGARTTRLQSETADPLEQARIVRSRSAENVGRVRRALKRGDATQVDLENAIAEANRARQEVVQQEIARYDARTSRLQSETADPIAQARIAIARGAARVDRIRTAVHNGNLAQTELENAIAEQNRNLQQLASAAVARYQASQGLAGAQFNLTHLGNEGAKLQFAIGQAQNLASYIGSQGSALSPEELMNAQRTVYEARAAYAEFVFQQAQDMVNARAELALAQASNNPIRQATIKAQQAKDLARFARTPAEQIRAQAQIISTQRDKQNTIWQEQLATIQFDADIGRIDHDVQIRRLESLLKTIKGNRDLRREIRRQIYQLKHDADSQQEVSLDVGDIKLPTTYEIRRAIRGGLNSGRNVQVTNHLGGVVVQGGDPEAVVDRIEQTFGTSTSSAMRSAGV